MKLTFTQGVLAGAELSLDKSELVIGRGAEADIQLLDERASRRHAVLRRAGDEVSVSDLGSRNGTFVNGVRIDHPQILRPGDQIVIGSSAFLLQPGEAASLAGAGAEEGPVQWAEPAPARGRTGGKGGLVLAGGAVLALGAVAAIAVLLLANRGDTKQTPTAAALVTTGTAAPSPAAAEPTARPTPSATGTLAATATTPAAAPVATPTQLLSLPTVALPTIPIALPGSTLVATLSALPTVALPAQTAVAVPVSTLVAALPTIALAPPVQATIARILAQPTLPPSYTVSWGPATYDPWEGGKRLRTDLTITNVSLPQMTPPYAPAFVIARADGSLRAGDLHDYSSANNPLPTLYPGQSVTWTWYTIMPVEEWVRGSAFRYSDLTWTQALNQDGSPAGPPTPVSDLMIAPLLPKELPSGIAPDLLPTILPSLLPTIMPGILPSVVPSFG